VGRYPERSIGAERDPRHRRRGDGGRIGHRLGGGQQLLAGIQRHRHVPLVLVPDTGVAHAKRSRRPRGQREQLGEMVGRVQYHQDLAGRPGYPVELAGRGGRSGTWNSMCGARTTSAPPSAIGGRCASPTVRQARGTAPGQRGQVGIVAAANFRNGIPPGQPGQVQHGRDQVEPRLLVHADRLARRQVGGVPALP
jgi:hypothetical protein